MTLDRWSVSTLFNNFVHVVFFSIHLINKWFIHHAQVKAFLTFLKVTQAHGLAFIAFLCSHPFHNFSFIFSGCRPLRPYYYYYYQNMGVMSLQQSQWKGSSLLRTRVLNILIYCYYSLVKRSSMHLLGSTVQIWAQNSSSQSSYLPPNNLLLIIDCHSSITNRSKNTLSE